MAELQVALIAAFIYFSLGKHSLVVNVLLVIIASLFVATMVAQESGA